MDTEILYVGELPVSEGLVSHNALVANGTVKDEERQEKIRGVDAKTDTETHGPQQCTPETRSTSPGGQQTGLQTQSVSTSRQPR